MMAVLGSVVRAEGWEVEARSAAEMVGGTRFEAGVAIDVDHWHWHWHPEASHPQGGRCQLDL